MLILDVNIRKVNIDTITTDISSGDFSSINFVHMSSDIDLSIDICKIIAISNLYLSTYYI